MEPYVMIGLNLFPSDVSNRLKSRFWNKNLKTDIDDIPDITCPRTYQASTPLLQVDQSLKTGSDRSHLHLPIPYSPLHLGKKSYNSW